MWEGGYTASSSKLLWNRLGLMTRRHDAVQEVFIEGIRTHFQSIPIIFRSSTIKFDDVNVELPERSAGLKPDLWFLHSGDESLRLVEFTIPYGCADGVDNVSTLELRSREKFSKYANLVDDCRPIFNRTTFLHFIIVSSLGIIEPHVFKELRDILGCTKKEAALWCKRLICCSMRGSYFGYYEI
jgi:hypothetical protein